METLAILADFHSQELVIMLNIYLMIMQWRGRLQNSGIVPSQHTEIRQSEHSTQINKVLRHYPARFYRNSVNPILLLPQSSSYILFPQQKQIKQILRGVASDTLDHLTEDVISLISDIDISGT